MAVSEIPIEGQAMTGPIYRITAADQATALQQFAQWLKPSTSQVIGVTLASNITRVTATPNAAPTYTVA
jgi:hypothetical protein